jgi:hypothetical protein
MTARQPQRAFAPLREPPVRHPLAMPGEMFLAIARLADREETTFGDMALQLIEAGLDAFTTGGGR